jgi:hypothetical protein
MIPHRTRTPNQHQKRRLKRILRIMLVAHHRAAYPQNHRPVPLDDRRERELRVLGLALGGSPEQLSVSQVANSPLAKQSLNMPERRPESPVSHPDPPPEL